MNPQDARDLAMGPLPHWAPLGKTGYYDFAVSYLGVDFGLVKYLLL